MMAIPRLAWPVGLGVALERWRARVKRVAPQRRRLLGVWRRGLRFGSLRSCDHLFALGAVRMGVAEAGSFQIRCGWLKDLAVGLRVL
jgi:hypothetical protein